MCRLLRLLTCFAGIDEVSVNVWIVEVSVNVWIVEVCSWVHCSGIRRAVDFSTGRVAWKR